MHIHIYHSEYHWAIPCKPRLNSFGLNNMMNGPIVLYIYYDLALIRRYVSNHSFTRCIFFNCEIHPINYFAQERMLVAVSQLAASTSHRREFPGVAAVQNINRFRAISASSSDSGMGEHIMGNKCR